MSRREDEEWDAQLDAGTESARLMAGQGLEWLLEGLFYACLYWIEKKSRPVLDTVRLQRAADHGLGAIVRCCRTAMAFQGLTAAEVDRRMRWPAGRTERVLARPQELVYGEEMQLAGVLGFQVDQCFGD
jgi:hypothetical protein